MEVQMILISSLLLVVSVVVFITSRKYKNKKYISFRESLALAELPVVTFYQGQNKINLILDTGASLSVIDENISKKLQCTDTNKVANLYSLGTISEELNIVSISLNYKEDAYDAEFQVVDMSQAINKIKELSGVTIHGILGNDFMQKYKYVLDFKEMIAYSRK